MTKTVFKPRIISVTDCDFANSQEEVILIFEQGSRMRFSELEKSQHTEMREGGSITNHNPIWEKSQGWSCWPVLRTIRLSVELRGSNK